MKPRDGCDEQALLLYYYGELAENARNELERHLADCAECRQTLGELKRTLAAIPRPEAGLSDADVRRFANRVLEQTAGRRHRRWPLWGGSLTAAAVAILLFLTTWGPAPAPHPRAGSGARLTAETEVLQNYELLQNLDLLENLDMLQQLETSG
jgi:anti-sigma factor RsiW